MSSAAKQKGTRHETDVVRYLNSHGIPARRVAQSGRLDTGDVHGVSPFILQCKNYRNMSDALRDGVAGAKAQAPRAMEPYGAAVVKRPGKSVADSYVVMDLADFARLLTSLQALPEGYDYD